MLCQVFSVSSTRFVAFGNPSMFREHAIAKLSELIPLSRRKQMTRLVSSPLPSPTMMNLFPQTSPVPARSMGERPLKRKRM